MNMLTPKRCAVYCRVSSDERLDQSFNSIDAQRESGLSHVLSQRNEGWVPVQDTYEDPGYSGGNMERPGLKRLMADIKAGKIDMVVVYKIDRLSRSLADFAKMVEVFDQHQVSFSSVTQQINSGTSTGRLMLNMLLSFAQFEREVTGERIRDKIAASKRKGLWMGGVVPLGYRVQDRQLLVDQKDSETVNWIFDTYASTGSTTLMVQQLKEQNRLTK
jgi:DNA invertase Pin-like site-specific DNA recombinase